MDFVHDLRSQGETIAAITTAPGEGAVAIVRISGEKALHVADRIFSRSVFKFASHTAHLGNILDKNGQIVDQVLLLVMLGARSFTGEDTVEIQCHGGSFVTRRILEVALEAGAKSARPGEFALKAFLNKKIDLSQAEAIQQLIASKNDKALETAQKQLEGMLSKSIESFQLKITSFAAILDAWVDFPEEGLEFMTQEEFIQEIHETLYAMEILSQTYHEGKIIHEGLSLCLLGEPNVGKSSLLNALLKKERAIVTDIAGTTRDALEEDMRLNGLHVKLIDTAGIRETSEVIEKEGIRRSMQKAEEADLILLVLEAKQGFTEKARALLATIPPHKVLIIFNKSDLPYTLSLEPISYPHLYISAKENQGLDDLKKLIDKVIWHNTPPSKEEVVLTSGRHKEALDQAIFYLKAVLQGLKEELSPEFLALDMRSSLDNLGKILGTNVSEDILSKIFSTFCIGK
jgi:tRNA modification GTPase